MKIIKSFVVFFVGVAMALTWIGKALDIFHSAVFVSREETFLVEVSLREESELFSKHAVLNSLDFMDSGVSRIFDRLKSRDFREPALIRIVLPKERLAVESPQRIRRAFREFCEYQVERAELEWENLRWTVRRATATGLFFLIVCTLAAFFVESTHWLPLFMERILVEGLIIIGWVSLWTPVDLVLFGWWPYWKQKKVYHKMAASVVEVVGK